ncbi:site-specific integrase [Sinomicrobium oceani]|uniref:site-specific integrase n=1 Tax=Sinomicrobium oceani TaxID=1150368 RepID=UPI00227BD36B|nr:site-specific integrase [Sinomicrobium oceani]
MQTSTTFSIHFWLKKTAKRKNGQIPVYARITVDGIRADLSTKRTTKSEYWVTSAGRVNPRISGAKSINQYLDDVYARLMDCHKQLHAEGKRITAQAIKLRYLGKDRAVTTLMELIDYHTKKELPKLAAGTAKNYGATEKYLRRFIKKKCNALDIDLALIDYIFITELEDYLRECPPLEPSQPLTHNGIIKHMERFQKFMNVAHKRGWVKQNPFVLYELKYNDYDGDFLEVSEIALLKSLKLKDKGMRLVRDIFIFACYTGLSYIEVKLLKRDGIVTGIDGETWIDIRRKKTKTPVKVPLLDEAKKILNRYANHPDYNNDYSLLPVFANQTINKYLKRIAKEVGINKHLTFHVARHTFATTITLLNNVPIETVSKLLGHTKLSTTQRYARVLEKKISNDFDRLRKVLKANSKEKPDYKPTSHGHLQIVK